ncbi:cytochrome c maturation protein CcmE [Sandaracinobacter sp. RS1-74]|uniref:cytochrome c maturation protein CcmE n=1 Tax=Sandaracinobacteroides sayramensis TaxID=2913411 RepID=UPI001EDC6DBF|nr:cytochrome c maturation protein CcmE [Sandaracinobacteroides sayramensis]MCG2841351.1 cytochrome c maturation protein CcmE [Sandaracinobacteroides sayramensis]
MAVARPRKQQRLVLALVALAVLAAAGVIAMFALEDTAAYFRAPADIEANPPAPGETFRLGGLVKPGSVGRSDDGLTLLFTVTDMKAETSASYRGLVPDLFREGQGVIATGRLDASGHFEAEQLLAKHDENYMPPEVAKALEGTGHPMDKTAAKGG